MELFNNVIDELERRQTTQPQLSTLWINYLLIKKHDLEEQVTRCNNMLSSIRDTDDDVSVSSLLLMRLTLSHEHT